MLKDDFEGYRATFKNNWAFQIKTILDNLGMTNVWVNQRCITPNLSEIKSRLVDQYTQQWAGSVQESSRLFYYNMYKTTFGFEDYLNKILDTIQRQRLTRFRLSSHKLAIETGRYNNKPKDLRKCIYCNMNAIETDYHFLLVCPIYIELRNKYFPRYYCRWPTIQKFKSIMSTQFSFKVCRFLTEAFSKRSNILQVQL